MKPNTGFALLLAFGIAAGALAAPSSDVAWTVQTQRFIEGGNADRGKGLAADCASCHGEDGVSPSEKWPSLAGQAGAYTYKQLRDYRDSKRSNAIMTAFSGELSEQDMADLAAYYARQVPPAKQDAEPPAPDIKKLTVIGDGERLMPACDACHGRRGTGNPRFIGMPSLAGQKTKYLAGTLRAYRSGERANDVYSVMRSIAGQLTDEEILGLSNYYAAQEPR